MVIAGPDPETVVLICYGSRCLQWGNIKKWKQ